LPSSQKEQSAPWYARPSRNYLYRVFFTVSKLFTSGSNSIYVHPSESSKNFEMLPSRPVYAPASTTTLFLPHQYSAGCWFYAFSKCTPFVP